MNLLLILFIPILTALGILFVPKQQSKIIALAGAIAQLVLTLFFFVAFNRERSIGNVYPILFEQQHTWFPSLGFSFHIGMDGISLSMILLTAFVVIAGVLVSWKMEEMPKEFFFLLILLSIGAYGFFMSLDLMLMFFFLEVAVIPKYLFISIWGSGNKTYAANKLALMLMGGSALILVGILGLYFSLPAG